MTDKEILQKAIEKAEKNGFDYHGEKNTHWVIDFIVEYPQIIIFNHDFAKAFWGDEIIKDHTWVMNIHQWQSHLQQMVLEKDKLKYIEKFL